MTETLDTRTDIPMPPLPPGVEVLHSPETDALKSSDEVASYLYLAAENLCWHDGEIEGVTTDSRFRQLPDTPYYTGPGPWDRTVEMSDDLGNKYEISALRAGDGLGEEWLSTSVTFTTDTGNGKTYTTAVYRDNTRLLPRAHPTDNEIKYSVSKYEDTKLDGVHDPTLTRTQPGELDEEQARAAEERYIKLANQFKVALELKLAQADQIRIIRHINRGHAEMMKRDEADQKEKAGGFMHKLGLPFK